jgi:hypothetical protein
MLTIVRPDKPQVNAQFDILREDGDTKEGLLYFNSVWGVYTVCRLLIKKTPDKTVAMTTEMPDNPGLPVTRVSEWIASYIKNSLLKNTDPERIVWIESYHVKYIPGLKGRESFFLVTYHHEKKRREYRYSNPSWRSLSKEEVRRLLEG